MTNRSETEQDNRTILRKLVVVAVLMFGFGWALVPLYRKICEVTGINVVTTRDADAERAARNTQVDTSRTVIVEFDANSQGPWRFRPHVNHVRCIRANWCMWTTTSVNLESRTMVGQAIPELRADAVGRAFPEARVLLLQAADAGGERDAPAFPVVFFVDPALPKDVKTITLSYTFFEVAGAVKDQAAASGAPRG